MKTRLILNSLILSILLISYSNNSFADRSTYDPTKAQFALPLLIDNPSLGSIVIDGVINQNRDQDTSEAWESAYRWTVTPIPDIADGVSRGHMVYGDIPESAEDLSYTIFIGFDSGNLYVGVSVNDLENFDDSAAEESYNEGNTWDDDSVEIFIDGDNSNYPDHDTTGTNPEIVDTGGQYVITFNNAHRDAEAGSPGMVRMRPGMHERASPIPATMQSSAFR